MSLWDRIEAVGPVIQLDDNSSGMHEPRDIPEACRPSLRSLLSEVKERLMPGQPVTDDEFNSFLEKIFANWTTGANIRPPTGYNWVLRPKETSIEIGVLAQACEASSSIVRRARSVAPNPAATQTTSSSPSRQAGQPVLLGVSHNKARGLECCYLDIDGNAIGKSQPVQWTDVNSKPAAYLRAMQAHDFYYYENAHYYNLRVAIYIARNRLTYWANGNEVATTPPHEQLHQALFEIRMCRNQAHIRDLPDGCLDNLKRIPQQCLFPLSLR